MINHLYLTSQRSKIYKILTQTRQIIRINRITIKTILPIHIVASNPLQFKSIKIQKHSYLMIKLTMIQSILRKN